MDLEPDAPTPEIADLTQISDPLATLEAWREQARAQGAKLPEAATLATLGDHGGPRARVVLLRGRDERSLQFFTNYESDKGLELERDPRAALCIHHVELGVQARIEGVCERLTASVSDAYFRSRPRLSQLGAWASDQSRPLSNRAELEARLAEVSARFAGADVPRPPHWGGFGLLAERVELWADRAGRLHERVRFTFDGASFRAQLLCP